MKLLSWNISFCGAKQMFLCILQYTLQKENKMVRHLPEKVEPTFWLCYIIHGPQTEQIGKNLGRVDLGLTMVSWFEWDQDTARFVKLENQNWPKNKFTGLSLNMVLWLECANKHGKLRKTGKSKLTKTLKFKELSNLLLQNALLYYKHVTLIFTI